MDEPTPPATRSSRRSRVHDCPSCGRVFARAEHLRRHQLSHENKKPNSCQACGARFARTDVLRRHTQKCASYARMLQERDNGGLSTVPDARPQQQETSPASGTIFSSSDSTAVEQPQLSYVSTTFPAVNTLIDSTRSLLEPPDPSTQIASEAAWLHGTVNDAQLAQARDLQYLATSQPESSLLRPALPEDFTFLEDFLLPSLATFLPGYATPYPSDQQQISTAPLRPATNETSNQAHPLQVSSPLGTARAAAKADVSYSHVFYTSDDDVEEFQKHFYQIHTHGQPPSAFVFPRRTRILRCLTAYFDYFDPHTPIIQHATFSIRRSHPALVWIILAIGAMHLGEHDFATTAYKTASDLLTHCMQGRDNKYESSFDFWPIQTLLLCVQYGAFSEDASFIQRAQKQFATVSDLLRHAINTSASQSASESNWEQWSLSETVSRLCSWACVLGAMLLINDPTANFMVPYQLREIRLPLQEPLWRARSAEEWASEVPSYGLNSDKNFPSVTKALLRGDPIPDTVGSFGLLALIAWAVLSICQQERLVMSMGPSHGSQEDFLRDMERALIGWSNVAYRRLGLRGGIYRNSDPIFTDCFALLSSSYYHLYLSEELRALKEMTNDANKSYGAVKTSLPPFNANGVGLKAMRYAVHSWLVRAKLGLGHWKTAAPLTYGVQYLLTAYENALVLSWWIFFTRSTPMEQGEVWTNLVSELLGEAYAEMADQGIPSSSADERVLTPLIFSRCCVKPSVYRYGQEIERKLHRFQTNLEALLRDG